MMSRRLNRCYCARKNILASRSGKAQLFSATSLTTSPWNRTSSTLVCFSDSAMTPSFAGKVYAYDVQSNKQLWSQSVDGGAQEPLVISNGVVYTVADNGSHARAHLVALDAATGAVKWQHTLNGSFLGDFCISNGVIYINSTNYAPNDVVSAQIDALDTSNGTTLWEYSQPGTGNIVPTE